MTFIHSVGLHPLNNLGYWTLNNCFHYLLRDTSMRDACSCVLLTMPPTFKKSRYNGPDVHFIWVVSLNLY